MTDMNFGAGEFWYLYLNNVGELRIVVVFINYNYLAEIIKCLHFVIDKKKMVYRTFYVRWWCKNLLVYTFCNHFVGKKIEDCALFAATLFLSWFAIISGVVMIFEWLVDVYVRFQKSDARV